VPVGIALCVLATLECRPIQVSAAVEQSRLTYRTFSKPDTGVHTAGTSYEKYLKTIACIEEISE